MKKICSLVLAAALCAGLLSGCGSKAASSSAASSSAPASSSAASASASTAAARDPGLYIDGAKVDADPIMTIDDEEVPFDVYRYAYLSYVSSATSSGADLTDATVQQQLRDAAKSSVLGMYTFRAMALKNNLTLSDDDLATIDKDVASAKEQMGDDGFAAALAQQNLTEDAYRTISEMGLYQEKVLRELYGDDILADVQKNFVHVQHILIKFADSSTSAASTSASASADHSAELAKAQEVLAKAKAGDDFSELMKQYNDDTGEPEEGYTFTTGKMVQEFEDAAFALKEGEISDIVETTYGYHIIKRLPIDDAYVEENLLSLLSDDMTTKVTDDLDKLSGTLSITYSDYFDKITPDTVA